jgi:CBS-domain-containing membrane protein
VLLKAQPVFVLMPMLVGSLMLTLMAVLFSRLRRAAEPYPHHWF